MPLTVPADTGLEVRQVYADAVDRIIAVVRDGVVQTVNGAGPAMVRRRVRQEVARLVADLDGEGVRRLADELEDAAEDGHGWTLAALAVLGAAAASPTPRTPDVRGSARYLEQATSRVAAEAELTVRATASDPSRAQRALWQFAGAGVAATTLRGRRTVEMESYAEMVTVNGARDARMFAAADVWVRSGRGPLVQVSGPLGDACPLCRPWEGRVLALGGGDPRYPSLDTATVAGLFHPNCRHITSPYEPGLAERMVGVERRRGRAAVREARDGRLVEAARKARWWSRREAAALDDRARDRARGYRVQWDRIARGGVAAST